MLFEDLKKISKHYVIYAIGSIMNKAIGFIMIPIYTRFITPAEYGIVGILNLVVWIIGLIVGMNMSLGVMRFYYTYKDEKEKGSVVSTSVIFIALVSLPILATLIYFSNNISQVLFNNRDCAIYVKLTFAALFFDMLLPIPLACFRIKNKSLKFLSFSVLQLFIGLSINIVLIVILKWGILGVLYSQLLTPLIMSPILLYITFKDFGLRFSLNPLKKIISYNLPLIPAGLAMIVLNFGDRYILKYFVSMADVGRYILGYKIALLLGFFVGLPFTYIWQPYSFSIVDRENAQKTYSKIFTYFALFISFIALSLAVLAKDIIRIVAAPNYSMAAKFIPPIVLGVVFYQLYYLLILGVLLKKKTQWLFYIVSIAACLNVAMNLFFIPRMGVMAAAYTTMISFIFLAFLGYSISQRLYRIPYELGRVAKIIFVGIGMYFVSQFIGFENLLADIFVKLIIVLSFPFVLYVFGFYAQEEIAKIPRLLKDIRVKFKAVSSRILGLAQS